MYKHECTETAKHLVQPQKNVTHNHCLICKPLHHAITQSNKWHYEFPPGGLFSYL